VTLASDERGQKQTAYRVLVASSQEKLARIRAISGQRKVRRTRRFRWSTADAQGVARGVLLKVRVWTKQGILALERRGVRGAWGCCVLRTGVGEVDRFPCAESVRFPRLGFPTNTFTTPPATMLRKAFAFDGDSTPRRFRSRDSDSTNCGINGRRVAIISWPPGGRVQQTHSISTNDVTSLLPKGANAVGAQVCGGWCPVRW
jgi:alpha-L-rhamnosidase